MAAALAVQGSILWDLLVWAFALGFLVLAVAAVLRWAFPPWLIAWFRGPPGERETTHATEKRVSQARYSDRR